MTSRIIRKPVTSGFIVSPLSPPAGHRDFNDYVTDEAVAYETDGLNHVAHGRSFLDDSDEIVNSTKESHIPPKQVQWGISWHGPAYLIGLALAGAALALGHHFYFSYLDGSAAGLPSRQQWALRLGAGFSFLVVALLRTACEAAYQQYIWTIVRRKPLSINVLNKLFSLTTSPTGFFSLGLFRHAIVAVVLAAITWSVLSLMLN
jgi:hypothetical protein